jgi:RNA polymerase sigma factor (sigma-70 family)
MDSSKQLIDEILILRCQIGDKDAFAELIEQYQKPLLYFINCLLEDTKAVEDVFQNTWLTVLKKIYTLEEPRSFSTWLYQIARNYVYKEFRGCPACRWNSYSRGRFHSLSYGLLSVNNSI